MSSTLKARWSPAFMREIAQRFKPWGAVLLLAAAGLGFWSTQLDVLDTFLARVGSSPLHWVHVSLDPTKSTIDWPTGTRNLGKSLPMHLYPWLDENFGITPRAVMPVYILFEIASMLAAFAFFGRTATPSTGAFGAAVFALIVALTSLQMMNLARFGYPFPWGLYYSLASASRILGLAFLLQGRPWPAMSSFAFAVCVHPLMGALGAAAGAVVVISRGFRECRRYLPPTLIAGGLAALWLFMRLGGEGLGGGAIPAEHWFALTEIFNSHFYPIELGVFTTLYDRHWLPLVSLAVLYVAIEVDEQDRDRMRLELRLVVTTLALLTVAGLSISYLKPLPFLVKLCLHRGSDLMVAVAFVVVLRRLWQDIRDARLARRALATVLLLSPVMHGGWMPGFPMLVSLLYAFPLVAQAVRNAETLPRLLVAGIWALGGGLTAAYAMSGLVENWASVSLTGVFYLQSLWVKLGLWALPLLLIVFLAPRSRGLPQAVLVVWIAVSVVAINAQRTRAWATVESEFMLQTQTWARDNTPEDALFMLDPGSYGGWRDISRRASFGTAQEWLHNAWLYDSDAALFDEGFRRFGLLGMEPESFYDIGDRLDTIRTIRRQATERYHGAPSEWFEKLVRTEGIDFFIFDHWRLSAPPSGLELAYENERYAVYAAPGDWIEDQVQTTHEPLANEGASR